MKLNLNILLIAVIAVLLFIIFNGNGCGNQERIIVDESIDTVWMERKLFVPLKSPIVRDTVYRNIPVHLQPSADYDSLLVQYRKLAMSYLATHKYNDTIHFDSSYVIAKRDITENKIENSEFSFNLKYPEITKQTNTTIIAKHRRQLFIGGHAGSTLDFKTPNIGAGFLYKNQKENLFGLDYSYYPTLQQGAIEAKTYLLVNLKRK